MGATHSNKSETIRNMLATGETVQHCAAFVGVSDGFVRSVASRAKNMASATVSATVETMQETGKPETSGIGVSKDKFEGSNEGPPAANVPSGGAVKRYAKTVALWATFILPTLASVANTYGISEAFSVHWSTSILVTIVVSGTPILYLLAGVKSWASLLILAITMGLEAFSNMAQTFKSLMGTMEYSWTLVQGTPSNLLNMVAVMTDSDHFGTALWMSGMVAFVLLAAQAIGMYHILKSGK